MDVLNMNQHPVFPRVIAPDGSHDSICVAPKRRVTIPEGYSIDLNWIGSQPNVSAFDNRSAKNPTHVGGSGGTDVTNIARIPSVVNPQVVTAQEATEAQIQAAQREAVKRAQEALAQMQADGHVSVANVQPETIQEPVVQSQDDNDKAE
jgi:hypothetical protein